MTDDMTPIAEAVEEKLVDEVVERLMDRADASGAALLGEGGLLTEVTRAVLERALDAEMTEHLGYAKHDPAGRGSGNSRTGTSAKTVLTDAGAVTVAVPRDRDGSFEPKLVPKHARRLAGFNDQILSLYARGMSVRDIRSHLAGMYGVEVSPDLISKSPTPSPTSSPPGRCGPWTPSGRSSTSTPCGSRSAPDRSLRSRSTSRSASTWTAARTSSACGSAMKAKAPRPG